MFLFVFCARGSKVLGRKYQAFYLGLGLSQLSLGIYLPMLAFLLQPQRECFVTVFRALWQRHYVGFLATFPDDGE